MKTGLGVNPQPGLPTYLAPISVGFMLPKLKCGRW